MSRNYEGPRPKFDFPTKRRDTVYPAAVREAAGFRDAQQKKYEAALDARKKGLAAFADFDAQDRLNEEALEAEVEASYGRDRYNRAVERDALAKLDSARKGKGLPSSRDRIADYELRRRQLEDTLNAFDAGYRKNGITDIAELDADENDKRETTYGKIDKIINATAKNQPKTADHLRSLRDGYLARDAEEDYRVMQRRKGKTLLSVHQRPTRALDGSMTNELPAVREFSEEPWFQDRETTLNNTTTWASDRKTLPWDNERKTVTREQPTTLATTHERVVADPSEERSLSPEAALMQENIRLAQERDAREQDRVNAEIDAKNEKILSYSSEIGRLESAQEPKKQQLDDAEREITQKYGVNPFAYQTGTASAWKTATLNIGRFLNRAIGRDDSEAGAALSRFFALNEEVMEEGAKIIRLRQEMKREQEEIAALENGKALAPKGPTPGFEYRPARAILERRRELGGYLRPTEKSSGYSPKALERARVAFKRVGYSPAEAARLAAEMGEDALREQQSELNERLARDERLRRRDEDELLKASINEDEQRIDDLANWNLDPEPVRPSVDRVTIARGSSQSKPSLPWVDFGEGENTLPYSPDSLDSNASERLTTSKTSGTFRRSEGGTLERVTLPRGGDGERFGVATPVAGDYNPKWGDNVNNRPRPARMETMQAREWAPSETVEGPAPERIPLNAEEAEFAKGKNFGKIPEIIKAHFWREPERFSKAFWAMPMYYNSILQNNMNGFGFLFSRLNGVSLTDAKKYIADAIRTNAKQLRGWWNEPGDFPTEKIVDAICTLYEGSRDYAIRNPQVPPSTYLPPYAPGYSLENPYASVDEKHARAA